MVVGSHPFYQGVVTALEECYEEISSVRACREDLSSGSALTPGLEFGQPVFSEEPGLHIQQILYVRFAIQAQTA